MIDLTTHIRAYAAKNAIEHGKADAGRILPKLFQHGLDKKDIGRIMPQIKQIVDEINDLDKGEVEEIANELHEFVKEREEKEKTLPELPNAARGKVITRLPPEPSKYLHLGHALSFLINYVYAKKYDGKCLLRFEDANPEKVAQEYVDSIEDDIKNYLGIAHNGLRFVSDDMKIMYESAEKLIGKGAAFMCFCDRETMQDLRHKGKECPCRNASEKETIELWNKFVAGKYKDGEAVLRFKGDMKALNHIMRDPVLFRGVKARHFKHGTKYKVWPMYDFYNPIEDSLMNVTHILRSGEFEQRVPLHDALREALGLKRQTIVQYGRFNVIDATTKGREIREGIEAGEYIGWDDPRLVTLRTLRRRGIRKEALYELVEQLGLSKKDANIDFDMIAAISRKLIDNETERYYFVKDPVHLDIGGDVPSMKETEIPKHPDRPKETRKMRMVPGKISIAREDLEENKGKEVRLLHLYNIQLGKGAKADFTSSENKSVPKLTWVASDFSCKVKVMMPDAKWVDGIGEENLQKLKIGDVVQFERFGFARLDKKEKTHLEFWFAHK